MRNESQVFTHFANLNRFLLAAMILAVALVVAACGNANGDNAKDEKEKAPAVPVEVAATQRAEMAALYSGTAPVESERKAFVMPKVQGEIRQVLADEGQREVEAAPLAAGQRADARPDLVGEVHEPQHLVGRHDAQA